MLKVSNVCSGYGNIQILNSISIAVLDAQIVSVVGSNGAGKTTLLKTICGLLPCMSGEIEFNGEKISGLPTHKIIEGGISMVPEGRQLFPHLTVLDNMLMGSYLKSVRPSREKNIEKMFATFPRLKERSSQMAGSLSGGEQQMLATARALMSNPKLLILDEPSWGLAPILVHELFEQLVEIKNGGTSVLIVEQNVNKALSISENAYVIEKGQIYMEGVGQDLLKNPDLKKAYLGI